jgi:hypothetical protein
MAVCSTQAPADVIEILHEPVIADVGGAADRLAVQAVQ